MSKKQRHQSARPNPSVRLSALRPQLERVLQQQDSSASAVTALDTLMEGLKPEATLPVLLAALAAYPAAQAELAPALSVWLDNQGYAAPLAELATRRKLDDDSAALASRLLAPLGIDATPPPLAEQNPFYAASFVGDKFQSSLSLFWYTSPQRQRAFGLSFLIDFQPPWEGSVKEAFRVPQKSPAEVIELFEKRYRATGGEPQRLPAAEAKRRLLVALAANRSAGVRLHRDAIAERELFLRYVLSLPDTPDTPSFSAEEFDYLATNGRRAEDIQRDEQRNGYQTRMPDGKIIRVMRPSDW